MPNISPRILRRAHASVRRFSGRRGAGRVETGRESRARPDRPRAPVSEAHARPLRCTLRGLRVRVCVCVCVCVCACPPRSRGRPSPRRPGGDRGRRARLGIQTLIDRDCHSRLGLSGATAALQLCLATSPRAPDSPEPDALDHDAFAGWASQCALMQICAGCRALRVEI